MTKDEALKLALETLQFYASVCNEDGQLTPAKTAIAKCKAALAQPPLPLQPVQEPVAEVKPKMTGGNVGIATVIHEIYSPHREPLQPGDKLYTTPPQREWVKLTFAEICECESEYANVFARNIEAKLKEKNNGT